MKETQACQGFARFTF